MKKILLLTSTMFFVLFVLGQKLPFQGKLIESGTPVNGTRSIEVGLPDLLWSETHVGVQITDGLYFIVLGSISPMPTNLFAGTDERQLTITVNGTALSPVTLYKPLAGGPDGLDLKGPGNGMLKGAFGTGSAVNENLPYLRLNGNLTNTFDRISANVSSNVDNTTEYGNVSVSSTDGYNSRMSPGYLGLNNGTTENVQLMSQNWSNKGYTGYMILRGPNTINIELGSQFWQNSDLPWMNMRGTSTDLNDPGLVNLSGTQYNDNGTDKERGQLVLHDSDKKKAYINSREIMLLKPDWSPFVSLSSNGNAGKLHLNGISSEVTINNADNVQKAAFGMAGNDNLSARLRMAGPDAHLALEKELHSPNPPIVFMDIENNGNGDFGRLILNGPNSTNFNLGIFDDPDHGFLQMNGKTNEQRALMFVKTDWDNQEKGTIELHGQDGKKAAIIPTQFALHKPDWSFYGRLFTENNAGNLELYGNASGVVLKKDNGKQGAKLETLENQNGYSGRLILSGPNNENIFLGTKDWETSGLPLITLKGSESTDKISLIILADDPNTTENEERGILDLHDSNGNGMIYGHNGVWSDKGPFSMWSGARVNGTLELNGNFTGSGTQTYSSDQRLKKDIHPLGENILGKIESLEGVSYYWRKDEFPKKNFSDDQQIGLIAQQLELQFPALVKTNDDGFKAVNYNGFTAVLLQAVKELNAKVEQLELENQKLHAEVSASGSNRSEIDQLKSQMEILTKLVMEKSTETSDLSSKETASSSGLK